MSKHPISRYPVPEIAELPDEKSGFVPNAFLVLAHRLDEFCAFFACHGALMEKPDNLTKAERKMTVVATGMQPNNEFHMFGRTARSGGRLYRPHQHLQHRCRACRPEACAWQRRCLQRTRHHARCRRRALRDGSGLRRAEAAHQPERIRRPRAAPARNLSAPSPGTSRADRACIAMQGRSARLGRCRVAADQPEHRYRADARAVRHLYEGAREDARTRFEHELPEFEQFWEQGSVKVPVRTHNVYLEAFRLDPDANPLATESGRILPYSDRVAAMGYEDCPPHPAWLEPAEWLENRSSGAFHLVSRQPPYGHNRISIVFTILTKHVARVIVHVYKGGKRHSGKVCKRVHRSSECR